MEVLYHTRPYFVGILRGKFSIVSYIGIKSSQLTNILQRGSNHQREICWKKSQVMMTRIRSSNAMKPQQFLRPKQLGSEAVPPDWDSHILWSIFTGKACKSIDFFWDLWWFNGISWDLLLKMVISGEFSHWK